MHACVVCVHARMRAREHVCVCVRVRETEISGWMSVRAGLWEAVIWCLGVGKDYIYISTFIIFDVGVKVDR